MRRGIDDNRTHDYLSCVFKISYRKHFYFFMTSFSQSQSQKFKAWFLCLLILTLHFWKLMVCSDALLSNNLGTCVWESCRFRTSLLLENECESFSFLATSPKTNINSQKEISIVVPESSTFWYSVKETKTKDEFRIPCEPNLDKLGPLPQGSYMPSKQCLISVGIDTSPNVANSTHFDKMDILRGIQKYIDQGITSFQMAYCDNKLDEGTIFGALLKQTPRSVISSCHFTSKLQSIPTQGKFQKSQVRNSILVDCLAKIGCEYIDNILVPCKCATYYVLEVRRNKLHFSVIDATDYLNTFLSLNSFSIS
jgi:hypothetical protein